MTESIAKLCYNEMHAAAVIRGMDSRHKLKAIEILLVSSKYYTKEWKLKALRLSSSIMPEDAPQYLRLRLWARQQAVDRIIGKEPSFQVLDNDHQCPRLAAAMLSLHLQNLNNILQRCRFDEADEYAKPLCLRYGIGRSEEIDVEMYKLQAIRARTYFRLGSTNSAIGGFKQVYEFWRSWQSTGARRFHAGAEYAESLLRGNRTQEALHVMAECQSLRTADDLPLNFRFELVLAEIDLHIGNFDGSLAGFKSIAARLEASLLKDFHFFHFDLHMRALAGIARTYDQLQEWQLSRIAWSACVELTDKTASTKDGMYALMYRTCLARANWEISPDHANKLAIVECRENLERKGYLERMSSSHFGLGLDWWFILPNPAMSCP